MMNSRAYKEMVKKERVFMQIKKVIRENTDILPIYMSQHIDTNGQKYSMNYVITYHSIMLYSSVIRNEYTYYFDSMVNLESNDLYYFDMFELNYILDSIKYDLEYRKFRKMYDMIGVLPGYDRISLVQHSDFLNHKGNITAYSKKGFLFNHCKGYNCKYLDSKYRCMKPCNKTCKSYTSGHNYKRLVKMNKVLRDYLNKALNN